jgi:hypothetical protein
MAVGVCVAALLMIIGADYFMSGVDFYWLACGS